MISESQLAVCSSKGLLTLEALVSCQISEARLDAADTPSNNHVHINRKIHIYVEYICIYRYGYIYMYMYKGIDRERAWGRNPGSQVGHSKFGGADWWTLADSPSLFPGIGSDRTKTLLGLCMGTVVAPLAATTVLSEYICVNSGSRGLEFQPPPELDHREPT